MTITTTWEAPPEDPCQISACEDDGGEGCPLDMSRVLIMDFVHTLEIEAARDGQIEVARLRQMAEAFLGRHRIGAKPPEHCLRLHRALMWDERRRHPFERLMIKRFAHMLPKRSGDDGTCGEAVLSRRMIPGFMVAVVKMIGVEHYDTAEREAQRLIDLHHAGGEYPLDWDALAKDPPLADLVDRALVAMAPHFQDFTHRAEWLTELVNGHLAPPPPEDGRRLWIMKSWMVAPLLAALYTDLRRRLRDERLELEDDLGSARLAALLTLHNALNASGV